MKFPLAWQLFFLLVLFAPASSVANGVSDQRILFGQSAALEGPAAALGGAMNLGIEVAFAEANRAGGVQGRRLELITLDDGYEPNRAIANTRRLLETDGVFAVLGEVGTPTSMAVIPLTEADGVPFIAPFSGAEALRDPTLGSVVNLRASYVQEAERGITHLVEERGLSRIAVLFQDDNFGRSGLTAVQGALQRRGLSPVADASYKRNTTAVKRALLDLRAEAPEAVFIVGAYKPTAAFIGLAREVAFNPVFMSFSFGANRALLEELGANGVGVLATQVMPLVGDRDSALVHRFLNAMAAYAPSTSPGFVELEGYLAGRLVVEVLAQLDGEPTGRAFVEAVKAGRVTEIDGFPLAFSSGDNQGSDAVYLTEIGPDLTFRAVGR